MHKHTCFLFLTSLALGYDAAASILEPIIENVLHLQTALPAPDTPGVWRKKMIWKARWVQEWKSAKTWKPLWRKVWSPVEIREWLPIPRPPPDFHQPEDHSGPPQFQPSGPPPNPNDLPTYPPGPHGPGPNSPGPHGLDPHGSGPHGSVPNGPGPQGPTGPKRLTNSYGPPQNFGPSTVLHPVADAPPPEWPSPDMEELLSNYHTIRDPNVESFNSQKAPNQYSPGYHVDSKNPEKQEISQFFEPPRSAQQQKSDQLYRPLTNTSSLLQDVSSRNQDSRNSVSPYAVKLAQAVIREKLNQSLKTTERPSGLTDIVYKSSATTAKSEASSSTESPSNIYIVTPVSFG